jgi:hypothetical protein
MQLDNVVELCFRVPSLPFSTDDQDPVTAELTLGHSFQVLSLFGGPCPSAYLANLQSDRRKRYISPEM